jgi:hypothetical protein
MEHTIYLQIESVAIPVTLKLIWKGKKDEEVRFNDGCGAVRHGGNGFRWRRCD